MDKLISMLGHDGCRGVMRSPGGKTIVFKRRGVADLFDAVTSHPDLTQGASVADKVIGLSCSSRAAWPKYMPKSSASRLSANCKMPE